MIRVRTWLATAIVIATSTSHLFAAELDDHSAETKSSKHRETPVHLGVLAGLGFPRPFAVEAMLEIDRTVALGVEYSALPTTRIEGVDLSMNAFAGDVRIFPVRGAPFFFGARFGKQSLTGAATVDVASYGSFDASMSMQTWFIDPRIGLSWRFGSGITVGMNAGVQIPLGHQTTSTLPAGLTVPSQATSIADTLGAHAIPTVTLLQLGVLL
jgi:hypothetical protein